MSRPGPVAVVGAGIVGARIARELLTPVPDLELPGRNLTVVTRRAERRTALAASFGHQATVVLDEGGVELPDEVRVVVLARAADEQYDLARRHLGAGRHVISTSDDPDEVRRLLDLDATARSVERTLVVGATMSPGLSCLLAAHAAALVDRVDEVHVARHGVAGPACARQRLRALRGTALDWRDGEWVRRPGFSGRELNWFPDPVSGHDCYRAELSEPLVLHPAMASATRITARITANRRDRALAPFPVLLPPPVEGGLGAVRVEIRGERDGERRTVVYGALDRPAIASGAVAAVAAIEALQGNLPVGAYGLAASGRELPMLAELARRGVRAAAFDGTVNSAGKGADPAERAQVPAEPAEESHTE